MRIVITDSGVGGLSVCAALEARLREGAIAYDLEVFYVNAALEDDYSYNSMPTRAEKLETFDHFLRAVLENYAPDLVFVACNTLSVLFEDSHFDALRSHPVLGIVDTGMQELLTAHRQEPESGIIVFATETTVRADAYSQRLADAGVSELQVVQQACPGLPDAISNDSSGVQAAALLADYIPAALERFTELPQKVLAFLGCTHYGYQAARFDAALSSRVGQVRVLNPNPAAASAILAQLGAPAGGGRVTFSVISRYEIPDKPLHSLGGYLGDSAPMTLAALRNFTHRPDLFRGARGTRHG